MALRIDNRAVTALRVARADGTLATVGEVRVARADGTLATIFTSAVPVEPRRVVILSAVPGDTTWALAEPTGDTEIFVDFEERYPTWGHYGAIFSVAVTCDQILADVDLTTTFPAGTVLPAGTSVSPLSDTPARPHTFTEVRGMS